MACELLEVYKKDLINRWVYLHRVCERILDFFTKHVIQPLHGAYPDFLQTFSISLIIQGIRVPEKLV